MSVGVVAPGSVGAHHSRVSGRPHWAQMVVATAAVMVLPAVIVGALGALGVISSVWTGVALSALLALAATSLGSAYWRRRTTGDALFSDLLLWGWLRRGRMERRLGRADDLLDQAGTADAERKGEILRDLGVALDAQDPYLDGHSRRVARYAAMTAHRLDLPDEQAHRVRTAAMIHDIGKLRIPEAIVNKPGRLTDGEFELMKEHAAEGGKMVESLGDAALAAAVRSHHERWDGSGYPDGLSGEQIPLAARIISVVDTFDALASARSYRAATPHAKVLRIIERGGRPAARPRRGARVHQLLLGPARGRDVGRDRVPAAPGGRTTVDRAGRDRGRAVRHAHGAAGRGRRGHGGGHAARDLRLAAARHQPVDGRDGPAGRDAERADRVAQSEHSAGCGHRDSPSRRRGPTAGRGHGPCAGARPWQ